MVWPFQSKKIKQKQQQTEQAKQPQKPKYDNMVEAYFGMKAEREEQERKQREGK